MMNEKQIAEWAENLADSDLWNRPARIEAIEKAARTLIAAVRKETREECARVCDALADNPEAGMLSAAAAIRNLQEREEGKT